MKIVPSDKNKFNFILGSSVVERRPEKPEVIGLSPILNIMFFFVIYLSLIIFNNLIFNVLLNIISILENLYNSFPSFLEVKQNIILINKIFIFTLKQINFFLKQIIVFLLTFLKLFRLELKGFIIALFKSWTFGERCAFQIIILIVYIVNLWHFLSKCKKKDWIRERIFTYMLFTSIFLYLYFNTF